MPERPATSCELCGPPISLDDDRVLRLSHLSAEDSPALADLYGRLDRRDLTRRFFTGAQAPSVFFESWADIESQGGFVLGAEIDEAGERRLVAEAGYALLDDGDGELGITVEPRSRGWLGPWILDALLAHAAERGVPNIQALVLVENRAMRALIEKRGFAVLGHPDWGTVRLSMSTKGRTPSWPAARGKPRILIEGERSFSTAERPLREAGFDVMLCTGPCDPARCPVLAGERCPLIDGADAVVVDLPANDSRADALMAAERVVHPGVRLVAGHERAVEGHHRRRPVEQVISELEDLLDGEDDVSGDQG